MSNEQCCNCGKQRCEWYLKEGIIRCAKNGESSCEFRYEDDHCDKWVKEQ